MRDRDARLVRLVGHGSSDNAASFGVYAFGLLPNWTAMRDSITLTVHYGKPLDMTGSTVIGLSQSGRTPDVVEYVKGARTAGAFTVAVTNDPGSELARAADATIPLAAEPELAVAATKTYVNTLAALALLAGHVAGRGGELAEGIGRAAELMEAAIPGLERSTAKLALLVLLHRPHVRHRPRRRVRHGAGDRAQAARDLPDRGGAAHGDGPRTRAGRGARPAVPGLGDRLERRHARRPSRRRRRGHGRWARASSRAARRRS